MHYGIEHIGDYTSSANRGCQPLVGDGRRGGAVRVVDGGVITLREEVAAFERLHVMECAIRRSRPAFEHTLGVSRAGRG